MPIISPGLSSVGQLACERDLGARKRAGLPKRYFTNTPDITGGTLVFGSAIITGGTLVPFSVFAT